MTYAAQVVKVGVMGSVSHKLLCWVSNFQEKKKSRQGKQGSREVRENREVRVML